MTRQVPKLEHKLKALPTKPGVYLFHDAGGQVLYIGKAKSLRPRVRSYFQASPRIGGLTERISDLEVIVTDTEVEALHLEQNLVKRHRPPFNVRLRDDKSFPYIAVTVEDEYPRVMFTRERHRRGVVYFGPYANAKKVRETLDVLNRVFPYRPCEGPQPGRHSGIPCLDYHIERCLAPCVGYVSKEDYRKVIDDVIEFLSGDTRPIVRQLEERMKHAAAEERFEEAARFRNRLFAVRHLAERQGADKAAVGTIDVIGIANEGDRAVVQVFPLRDGKLIDRYSFHLENVEGQDAETILEAFVLEYYGSAPSVPPQIVVPRDVGDTSVLAEFLTARRGSRVEVRAAERGEKRRLQELATQNARLALDSEGVAAEQTRLRRVEALEELREALNLESLPLRIECYDISNIQEASPVGSMVVFQDAVPKKAHYRKFGIKGAEGQDDFAALAEVVSRRFARMRDVADEEYDESFAVDAEPRPGRRRQGAALGGAGRDAGLRPAAGGRDLAREAGRGGLRPRPARADRARAALAGPPASPARSRRGAPLRARLPPAAARDEGEGVDLRHARGRRARAQARAAPALRLGGAIPRRVPGGARGRDRGAGEDGALDLRAAPQGGPGLTALLSERPCAVAPAKSPQRDEESWRSRARCSR